MPQRSPRQSLNKAYLKMKPLRKDVEGFAETVSNYLEHFEASFSESEEHHKKLSNKYFLDPLLRGSDGKELYMNTVRKADLAIHDGGTAKSAVKVLLEYKSPSNPREMPTEGKLDCKATRELLLYYLRQRITEGNLTLTKLAVTNGAKWFIWDAQDWERAFREDKQLIKQFKNFEAGVLSGSRTETFYKEIASPVLTKALSVLAYTYVDLRELPKFPLPVCPTDSPRGRTEPSNGNPALDSVLPSGELVGRSSAKKVPPKLIAAYKLFSGTHLLKLPFANDSNSLNKEFYNELLHIMGLEQYEVNNKKLIGRAKEGNRNPASLLEATIEQLESDGMTRVANKQSFASDRETQTYEVALALVITWINRILFCKLLEGQLLGYHNGDRDYAFMAHDTIGSYDALADLWFKALAKQLKDRSQVTRNDFKKIPYLNSSLFEVTTLEKEATSIKALRDDRKLPFYHHTVLKAESGKQARRSGSEETLRYLLQFLDAYEFGSEVSEGEVLDEPRGLINASVLGLIFEKINGYKEGSFYTPGFVTEYMCRETIRAAIVSRFKESQHPALKIFDSDAWSDLVSFRQNLFRTDDLRAAEKVIDTLTLCDPAVGSGHFLVSALNELLAAKSELNLLLDEEGVAINEVAVGIVNDDLDIRYSYTDDLYEYKPGVPASDRTQKTLFEQKRRLIENCLFGVDINPNSVKICRLRLWIELLKHAYYHKNGELETLPNIDINIKTGNSLVSRFKLDSGISNVLKRGITVANFRETIKEYQGARSADSKEQAKQKLKGIRQKFKTGVGLNDRDRIALDKAKEKFYYDYKAITLYDGTIDESKTSRKIQVQREKDEAAIKVLETKLRDRENSKLFVDSLEWRYEFPQVLNEKGEFIGFDVVVGNPPYIRQEELTALKPYLKANYKVYRGTSDILTYFVELGLNLVREGGQFSYIISNKFMRAGYGKELREYLRDYNIKELIDFGDLPVFDEATTYPLIMLIERSTPDEVYQAANVEELFPLDFRQNLSSIRFPGNVESLATDSWSLTDRETFARMQSLRGKGIPLGQFVDGKMFRGILTGLNDAFVINEEQAQSLIDAHPSSEEVIKPFLAGRDIKRYQQPEADKYLIKFERGQTRGIFGDGLSESSAHALMQKAYPAIFEWLDQKEEKAKARYDQGEFWWELRACDYWGEFEKPKILYQEIATYSAFTFDSNSLYANNKVFILPNQPAWLLAILNSSIVWEYIKYHGTSYNGGAIGMQSPMISQIPIVEPSSADKEVLDRLVGVRMGLEKDNFDKIERVEGEIEGVVGRIYGDGT